MGPKTKPTEDAKKGFFAVTNPRCKICQLSHVYRRELEMMLATGWTQMDVLRHWNGLLAEEHGPDYLNKANMSVHAHKHLTVREEAIRQIIEQRAVEFGKDVNALGEFLLTKEGVLEAIIATGLQNIAKGLTTVEPRELVNALELAHKLEKETGDVAQDELWRQFYAFQDAVKRVVTIEQRELIAAAFERNLNQTGTKALTTSVMVDREKALAIPMQDPEPIEEGEIIDVRST